METVFAILLITALVLITGLIINSNKPKVFEPWLSQKYRNSHGGVKKWI